jgi:hypothetical protein
MSDGTGLGGSTITVEQAKAAVEGWLAGRTPLTNRQDVAVVLYEEVKRLESEAP